MLLRLTEVAPRQVTLLPDLSQRTARFSKDRALGWETTTSCRALLAGLGPSFVNGESSMAVAGYGIVTGLVWAPPPGASVDGGRWELYE